MNKSSTLTPLEILEYFNPNNGNSLNLNIIYVFLLFFFEKKNPGIPVWFQKLTYEFFENSSIKECIEKRLDLICPNDLIDIIWHIFIYICLDKKKLEIFKNKLIQYQHLLYPKFRILDISSEYLKQNPHTKCYILDIKNDDIIENSSKRQKI